MNSSVTVCMSYHWKSVGHQVFQYLFETVLGFFLPFTFIIVCYTSVICGLRRAMFQHKGRGNRLILLIIGTFALFWLPYHLVNILQVRQFLNVFERCYVLCSSSLCHTGRIILIMIIRRTIGLIIMGRIRIMGRIIDVITITGRIIIMVE